MYKNIGKKIKKLATGTFIAELIVIIVVGISFLADDEDLIIWGVVIICGGSIAAWVSTWLLYGFGELIDKVSCLEAHFCPENHTDYRTVHDINRATSYSEISKYEKYQNKRY